MEKKLSVNAVLKNIARSLIKMVAVIATTAVHVADVVMSMSTGIAYENSHFK